MQGEREKEISDPEDKKERNVIFNVKQSRMSIKENDSTII